MLSWNRQDKAYQREKEKLLVESFAQLCKDEEVAIVEDAAH
jgi:hypothetical protein